MMKNHLCKLSEHLQLGSSKLWPLVLSILLRGLSGGRRVWMQWSGECISSFSIGEYLIIQPLTGKLRSFDGARLLVRLQLIAKITATAITNQRVVTDVLTRRRLEPTLVVIWLHGTLHHVHSIQLLTNAA